MDKKSDYFFFTILILVLFSFITLNLLKTFENYIIKKHNLKENNQ
jgi:hypothetical protein